ncbi:uncharacterized protein BP5553_03178 [Venustampulla echinocandica]|uniref:C3H1-type domain-containing protein n=1 Tax=Venustampulla echinocandica TaxID=2656787 RepID=A0A370TTL6_9HELO|nr:uncharacterized protein BP5553_03178 [Venustampulla echinocandica]RDL38838.1 hypothetical protein BP5553_03178 [Venustampulla echinocandica]
MSSYAPLLAILVAVVCAQTADLSQYVLTAMGGANGGNTFPGVSLPFAMVKLGPDVLAGGDSYSGSQPTGNFTGFSMMHESGTGGAPKYGVVSQMPVLGHISNPLVDQNQPRSQPDITSVGYYKATLAPNITVELSATSRAGFYQYTFPPGKQTNVVVDVSHILPSRRNKGLSQHYVRGNITTSGSHYEGFGDYNNGWNRAPDWRVYFCGYFDTPAMVKTFVEQSPDTGILSRYSDVPTAASTARIGAVFSFNTVSVTSRVGISFISGIQACHNVNTQMPAGTTLSSLTTNAKKVWNEDVLSKVTTTETNLGNLQMLYSSMYFMHLIPSNRTGENPLWKSTEPYYDDTFTTWDLFRCTFSLLQVFQPSMYEEYIRSLIDIFRFEGYMPDGRSSNFNGVTQGGSNSDNVLADAYVKGVRGAVNWTTGYEAMVKDAEVAPVNNNDPRDPSSSTKEGRGALPDWLKYGFITPKYGRAVTRAVEYSVNDFSLYQVAMGLGKKVDAEKYIKRSRNWRNHWDPNATSVNFTGFLVPRSSDGFIAQDPLSCGGCYWADAYYEALPWEYSFNSHHDINTLIALSGGPDTFTSRLKMTFKPGVNPTSRSSGFNNTIFNPGNEPSFTTPYLYNFVGRQDLSVKQSRSIANSYYLPTPGGLPGNSDAGAMESWLLWNMLGLYPLVGQTTFLIGSPWFVNTSISLSAGQKLTITAIGGSRNSYYVQSLNVNGQQWNQSWLTWADIFDNGGTMDFVLGPEPRNWTTGKPPPSPASEFADTTAPSMIVPPGRVHPAPSLETQANHSRGRKLRRDVALALMGGILGVVAGAAFLWWFNFGKLKIFTWSKSPVQVERISEMEEGAQSVNLEEIGRKMRSTGLLSWPRRIFKNWPFRFAKIPPAEETTVANRKAEYEKKGEELEITVVKVPPGPTKPKEVCSSSDADADILADYVLALLRHDGDTETVRALCMAEIPPFLGDDSPLFVQDVFNAIHYKSYIPGAAAPPRPSAPFAPPTGPSIPTYGNAALGAPYGAPNGSRKRSYNDRGDGDAQQYPSDPNGRLFKQPRRGGPIPGRGGFDNFSGRGGYPRGRPPMHQGPLPAQGFMPPMPSPPPGMPPFDPTDPTSFMYALQGMGFPTPELGGLPTGPSTHPRKQRCRDYDQKGFCARGNTCMYEHGDNSIFVPPGKTTDEYDPSNASLMAGVEKNESDGGSFGFGNTRDADRGRGGRGRGGGSRGDRGGQFSNPNRRGGRAEFSSDRPNHDRSKTAIVVENIPEDKFSEDEVREFFSQFGTILDISMRPYKRLAIVKYEDWNAANAAYTSPKVIFDNRFVKVYWFSNTESLPRPAGFSTDKDAAKNGVANTPSNETRAASDPQIDVEEFARKQEEAQKVYEEKMKRKQEMETARKELEKRQEELAKNRAEEKRKLMEKLAAKTGRSSATPGTELDGGAPAPAGDGKTTSQTEALKAQLAALEAEAQSLGLDTSLTDDTSFAFRGRGRGRGGYRGRGTYAPRGYRGGFRGRGGAPFAGGTYRLDNRPKTVALTGLDFSDAEKDEGLRQYLLGIGDYTDIDTTPVRTTITFKERFMAEKFMRSLSDGEIPSVGKVELAWVQTPLPPVNLNNTSKPHGDDTAMDEGDAMAMESSPPRGMASHEREPMENLDYDIADDNEWGPQ